MVDLIEFAGERYHPVDARGWPCFQSETEVGAVAGFGIGGACAIGLAAPDGAFGNRTAAHGPRLCQFGGELTNIGRNVPSSGHSFMLEHNAVR